MKRTVKIKFTEAELIELIAKSHGLEQSTTTINIVNVPGFRNEPPSIQIFFEGEESAKRHI